MPFIPYVVAELFCGACNNEKVSCFLSSSFTFFPSMKFLSLPVIDDNISIYITSTNIFLWEE